MVVEGWKETSDLASAYPGRIYSLGPASVLGLGLGV